MKALYKKHQGFQNLNSLSYVQKPQPDYLNAPSVFKQNFNQFPYAQSPSFNQPSLCQPDNNSNQRHFAQPKPMTNEVEETSTKKYANNKYYQFNNQSSSGRKFLKEKLNLYSDKRNNNESQDTIGLQKMQTYQKQQNNWRNQLKSSQQSFFGQKKGNNKISQQFDKQSFDRNKKFFKNQSYQQTSADMRQKNGKLKILASLPAKQQNKKIWKSQFKELSNFSEKSFRCKCEKRKKGSEKVCAKNKSRTKQFRKTAKSSRFQHKNSCINEQINEQLKHYKKLCLQLRRNNCALNQELQDCHEQSKRQLSQLQKNVDQLNEKINRRKQNKQNIDRNKADRIMQSLSTIKTKLSKKQNQKVKQEKKFYSFFKQSLGVLKPEFGQQHQLSCLETKVIWKHMLQFLVTHGYKIDQAGIYSSKFTTLR